MGIRGLESRKERNKRGKRMMKTGTKKRDGRSKESKITGKSMTGGERYRFGQKEK